MSIVVDGTNLENFKVMFRIFSGKFYSFHLYLFVGSQFSLSKTSAGTEHNGFLFGTGIICSGFASNELKIFCRCFDV